VASRGGTVTRVSVNPDLLLWASVRSGKSQDDLHQKFNKLGDWITGQREPTFKQLEAFAKATYTPFGYFFLQTPPTISIPIPDMRTMKDIQLADPSPNLLDTIYACEQRQEWYRIYSKTLGEDSLSYVGSASVKDDIVTTSTNIRDELDFSIKKRQEIPNRDVALRHLIDVVEDAGILVMVNGVVGSNNSRKLDPAEFRGFALSDDIAPLIFLNGADSKAAQMFTLAHELAHIWLGESAISDSLSSTLPDKGIERWCNAVAAELLVPLEEIRGSFDPTRSIDEEMNRLAKDYKVSSLVILRRVHDAGFISKDEFWDAYRDEENRLAGLTKQGSSGGDFYRTTFSRVSKRFARALVSNTLEGQTLHRDAFRMLGLSKLETFHELGRKLEVI